MRLGTSTVAVKTPEHFKHTSIVTTSGYYAIYPLLSGRCRQYTSAFREHDSTTVGLLFDGPRATLTYFKDGVCLGAAFTGIDTRQTLYPAICSTGLDRFFSSFSYLTTRETACI